MILRRVIEHVRTQNWTAVALDFVIVVVGVFMGIQLGNWNDARADRSALQQALLRLVAEIDANLEKLAETEKELQASIPNVTAALDTLRECASGSDAETIIAAGLNEMKFTRGIKFRVSALREVTENPALTNQQSEGLRRILQTMRHDIEVWQRDASSAEMIPFEEPVWRFANLKFGEIESSTTVYRGNEFASITRRITPALPPEEMCRDERLISQLYEYEWLQGALATILEIVTTNLEEVKITIINETAQEKQ